MILTNLVFYQETSLHRLYKATQDGQPVILKAVREDPEAGTGAASAPLCEAAGVGHYTVDGEGSGIHSDAGWIVASRVQREQLLVAEAKYIDAVGSHWNHQILGMCRLHDGHVRVSPGATVPDPDPLALVMPQWAGTSLASLPRSKASRVFPTLLPALWQALTDRAHGDLKPASIFLDASNTFFRILDPGVHITPAQDLYKDRSPTAAYDRPASFFITNSLYYPILFPFPDLPSFQYEPAYSAQRQTFKRTGQPTAPDLLALGLMYFHLLIGQPLTDLVPLERSRYSASSDTQPYWFLCAGTREPFAFLPPGLSRSDIWIALSERKTIAVLQKQVGCSVITQAEAKLCHTLLGADTSQQEIMRLVARIM